MPRREARSHQEGDDDHVEQHDEAHDADCPGEADLREEALCDRREDEAAGRGAACLDSDRYDAVLVEVGGNEGDHRGEVEAVADALADAFGEEDLPVGGRRGGREDAEELEREAAENDLPRVSRIGEAAGEGANEEKEKDLDRANPGDV